MFGVKVLIEKLNTAINSGSLTETQLIQAFGAIETLEKQGVSSVLSVAYLPNVVENKGRFFWLQTEQRYVVSNGTTWSNDNIFGVSFLNLYAWGSNGSGRLGDNTTVNKSSPAAPLASFTFPGQSGALFNDWVFAQGGNNHSLGIRANGTMWGWGANGYGKLGDNTTVSKSSPVSVVGGFTDWVSCSTGTAHSLGLRANGTLYAWGTNNRGQLGSGTIADRRSSPTLVSGGFTDWVMTSAGVYHSLGLLANGTLWGWGRNVAGSNGDGTATQTSSPVSVVGGFTDWIMASAGNYHSLGLRANGVLYGWGDNANGQIGDGTAVAKSSPVSVIGGFTDWVFVSGGWAQTLAIRANGTMWGWGTNYNGRLGINSGVGNISSPASVVGGFTDWVSVSTGRFHTVGLRANGTLWAWGGNAYGEMGTGNTTSRSSPVSVVGGFTDWKFVNIASDARHTVGIRG